MANAPPNIEPMQNSTGTLKSVFCKKCNKQLNLRDLDLSNHKNGIIKCKRCGSVVEEKKEK